jgi:hypothetical protein
MEDLASVLRRCGKRREARVVGNRAEQLGGRDPTRVWRNRVRPSGLRRRMPS